VIYWPAKTSASRVIAYVYIDADIVQIIC